MYTYTYTHKNPPKYTYLRIYIYIYNNKEYTHHLNTALYMYLQDY